MLLDPQCFIQMQEVMSGGRHQLPFDGHFDASAAQLLLSLIP